MVSSTAQSPAHTPGPWHVSESENAAVYNGEKHWAILPNPQTTHGQVIADIETICPEADASARLIAAAPDLLQRLKDACYLLHDLCDDANEGRGIFQGEIALLEKAIAQAEGR